MQRSGSSHGFGGRTAAAFAVHIFTACGAACALLALLAAAETRWRAMFLWLGVALIIDGTDGPFARRLRVAAVLPRWSGEVLDLVVDVMTYVFVPAYALAASGLLPQSAAVPLGSIVVVTGALYFADQRMKTSDYYFRGFPAVWNVAVFYLRAAAASLACRSGRPGAGDTHLRSGAFHSSDPHSAFACSDHSGIGALGPAGLHRAHAKSGAGILDRRGTLSARGLLRRRRFFAPPPSS
jgi:phosphatidylglycerophosphate synthase